MNLLNQERTLGLSYDKRLTFYCIRKRKHSKARIARVTLRNNKNRVENTTIPKSYDCLFRNGCKDVFQTSDLDCEYFADSFVCLRLFPRPWLARRGEHSCLALLFPPGGCHPRAPECSPRSELCLLGVVRGGRSRMWRLRTGP